MLNMKAVVKPGEMCKQILGQNLKSIVHLKS